MKHALSQLESRILTAAVGDIERIFAAGPISGYGNATAKMRYADALEGRVRCSSFWADLPMDAAARMRISRAYTSLEKRGLVVRVSDGFLGARVTHLEPTDAGRALAANLRRGSLEAAVDG